MASGNKLLNKAKAAKEDEFYTQITDIENELRHYKEHFKGKVVFCNCDDPVESNFWKYFELNFTHLGLKKLISTHYDANKPTYKLELVGDINGDGVVNGYDIIRTELKQNGDFRSPESIEILKEADIVVTNPPFSLFREYVAQLMEYEKDFLILGSINAIKYKEIFPLIKNNLIWTGHKPYAGGMDMIFPAHLFDATKVKKYSIDKFGNFIVNIQGVIWFTNLDTTKRHENLICYKTYQGNEDYYPQYVNYTGIDVKSVTDIPVDYYGDMGVPITFLECYNPNQFELIGTSTGDLAKEIGITKNYRGRTDIAYIDKDGKQKCPYQRLIIRRKK